jgi:inhibitor of growth protein 3
MPRDDLSIDFNSRRGMMPQTEHQDAAAVLDEWVNRVANLPAEIAFMQEEMEQKDRQMQECLSIITKNDNAIQKWIRLNGSHVPNPKEEAHSRIIHENYDKAQILQEEKIALAQKTQQVMDKHTRWIDSNIKALQDRGEFPNDPEIPSLLRPQQELTRPRIDHVAAAMPLGAIASNNATLGHPRHPNQHPPRMIPAHVQTHPMTGISSSAPATPAASMLMGRQARESSLGAAANKRQRLTGGLGTLPPSGLARQSSMTPNTPRAGTPGGAARAGSAGPRLAQKSITAKKVAPQGSRQSGALRKSKKSGLNRVKSSGNKNSPSSTNDSELSDADSGSGDEDDEAVTPPPTKDGDQDEEMGDVDDEDGGDNRKYCICHSISYGDMVACDNESCKLEWFHWSCVGLKSEPVGTWICPVCTKEGKKSGV